jgi:hypothetical protein
MDVQYVSLCLKHCNGDVEAAILALLEGRMPSHDELKSVLEAGPPSAAVVPDLGLEDARDDPQLMSRIASLIRVRRCTCVVCGLGVCANSSSLPRVPFSFDEYNDEYEDGFDDSGIRVRDSTLEGLWAHPPSR